MQKIKILVDGRWFDSYYSGITTYLKGIYNSISKDPDFKITVIGRDIKKLEVEFQSNVEFIEFKTNSNFKRLYFDIPRIIEKQKYDFAHFQYICPITKRCKYIVTLHDLLFLDYKKDFPLSFIIKNGLLFYISAKRSDILLTVSEFSKMRIAYHYKIKDENIFVTPNGVLDCYNNIIPNLNSHLSAEYGNYILYVSRIEPRKNHLSLLKAYVELQLYEKYNLLFIGKKTIPVVQMDAYLGVLPDAIRRKIIIIENISEDELIKLYSNASLFVYPSLSEGFGIPPIEAICSGVKTICSNATALSDFFFLLDYQFNPENINELKSKLLSTLSEKNYPSEKFKKIINEKYNWDTISENLKKILLTSLKTKVK